MEGASVLSLCVLLADRQVFEYRRNKCSPFGYGTHYLRCPVLLTGVRAKTEKKVKLIPLSLTSLKATSWRLPTCVCRA